MRLNRHIGVMGLLALVAVAGWASMARAGEVDPRMTPAHGRLPRR